MFWKKKKVEEQPIQQQQQHDSKQISVMYEATGINDEGDEDEDYKDIKRQMLAKFQGKLYTRSEIVLIGQKMEMDAYKAFRWEMRTVARK